VVPRAAAPLTLAVPAYFAPGPLWQHLAAGAAAVGLAVANPDSGPGAAADPAYAAAIRQAQAHGVPVLGYVCTSYGRRPAAEVAGDVERYLGWYVVDGIFFDEASADCAMQPYYAALDRCLKAQGDALISAINPGTQTQACYMGAADIIVTFEGTYDAYLQAEHEPFWVHGYEAARFWHIVYAAPDAGAMRNTLALARRRRAGRVFVTDASLPNPYNRLPLYWNAELDGVASFASAAGSQEDEASGRQPGSAKAVGC